MGHSYNLTEIKQIKKGLIAPALSFLNLQVHVSFSVVSPIFQLLEILVALGGNTSSIL